MSLLVFQQPNGNNAFILSRLLCFGLEQCSYLKLFWISHWQSLVEETERWFIVTKEMQSVWKTDPWIVIFREQKDDKNPKAENIRDIQLLNWGCRWFYDLPKNTQSVRGSENLNSCLTDSKIGICHLTMYLFLRYITCW